MAREFTQPWSYVTAPIQNIPGAAGQAQQPQVIIPPGYGSYQDPMTSAIDSMAEGFMNYAAQQKAQKQYQESVKGLGEFWPILQATGVSEGQVNEMLRSGLEPKDIVHYALTQQASRAMKGLEWGREDYTHQRDISEKSYTPDQMDIVDSYKSGKISLSDAMRQSGLTPTQLKSAIDEATAGEGLQQKPFDTIRKGQEVQKADLELKDLPDKLKQEGKERLLRIDRLKQEYDMAPDKEARENARLKLEQDRLAFDKWKAENGTRTKLPPELQKQANNIKGLASPRAMYSQMLKLGYKDVRPPSLAPKDAAGFSTGKDETKDSYFKDVILPRLQNARPESTSTPSTITESPSYKFPKGPYGAMAPKIASSLGIDANIFGRLIQQESGWNPNARSPVGAFGMGQFMPGTAKQFGYSDAQLQKDPMLQLSLAASYFKKKLDEFGGDYAMALAAYNAGSEAVRKYNGVPPFKETQAYVKAILGTDNIKPVSTKRKSLNEIF